VRKTTAWALREIQSSEDGPIDVEIKVKRLRGVVHTLRELSGDKLHAPTTWLIRPEVNEGHVFIKPDLHIELGDSKNLVSIEDLVTVQLDEAELSESSGDLGRIRINEGRPGKLVTDDCIVKYQSLVSDGYVWSTKKKRPDGHRKSPYRVKK
jgi:hypothetical protein